MHGGWGGNRYDQRKFSPLIIVIIGVVVLSTLRVPWPVWMLFFMFGIPMITRLIDKMSSSGPAQRGNWRHHRGHHYHMPHQERTPWDATPREKRKNGFNPQRADDREYVNDLDIDEKPKHRPVYVVGDDGELVEVMEEPPSVQPKAKRAGGNEDGYEYV